MKPNKFVLKPLILTTKNVQATFLETEFVGRVMGQAEDLEVRTFQVKAIDPVLLLPVEVYVTSDGSVKLTHDWFFKNITQVYNPSSEYNWIVLDMTREERDTLGLDVGINGMYWTDKNHYLECWVSSNVGQRPATYRTREVLFEGKKHSITENQRMLFHEGGHAVTHFSGRKAELRKVLNIAEDVDPTHYCDYVLRDVSLIFKHTSFKKWSLLKFAVALAEQLIPLLKKKPAPVEPLPSRLDSWARAIEKFEGYVLPGERYSDGRVAPDGSLSYRNRNPGNLRWSPFMAGVRNNFAYFHTYNEGYEALLHQLRIAANGSSSVYTPDMTLREFFEVYAPSSDNNHPATYAAFVAREMGIDVNTEIKNLL